ncbi:MAG: hypothetical protein ACE5IL_16430, partial [Myxococcota bacterium]
MSVIESYRRAFEARAGELAGAARPALSSLRRGAMESLEASGLPTRRWEEWHALDLRPFTERAFDLSEPLARVPALPEPWLETAA